MCVLNFLKEINGHYANLLILGVAIFALVYAIREYKTKNLPIFAPKMELFTREDGTFVNAIFKNRSNHPIEIEILDISVLTHFGTSSPTFEKFRILQEGQEDVFHCHHFDNSQIERLRVPPNGEPHVKPVVLSLRALSRSIVDRNKKLECVVEASILFSGDKKHEIKVLRYDLRVA